MIFAKDPILNLIEHIDQHKGPRDLLTKSHVAGALVTGSGITLASPLKLNHDRGSQVASNVPTPGKTNQYAREQ